MLIQNDIRNPIIAFWLCQITLIQVWSLLIMYFRTELAYNQTTMSQYLKKYSTYKSFSLTWALSCLKCKPSLKMLPSGIYVQTKLKSCLQPWGGSWVVHCEILCVHLHRDTHEHIPILILGSVLDPNHFYFP